MKLLISKEDIKEGVRYSCQADPISNHIRRKTKKQVTVEGTKIVVSSTKAFPLPKLAKKFIEDFDNGVKVVPFSFEIKGLEDYL